MQLSSEKLNCTSSAHANTLPVRIGVQAAAIISVDTRTFCSDRERHTMAHPLQLRSMINRRHNNQITEMTLYKDEVHPDNVLPNAMLKSIGSIFPPTEPATECVIFYDYFPHIDPFAGRPCASQVHATNPAFLPGLRPDPDRSKLESEMRGGLGPRPGTAR